MWSYLVYVFSNNLLLSKQIKTMEAAKKPGVIINLGSASGLYPLYSDPIYTASKGLVFVLPLDTYFLFKDSSTKCIFFLSFSLKS